MTLATEAPTVAAADRAGIEAAILDYIEGWYHATPERTERSLHPTLAKRLVASDRVSGEIAVQHMDAATLIGYVRQRAGDPPPARRQADYRILDIYGDIATARAEMNDWVDYLHLGRVGGRWQIVNVLWALKPREEAA